MQVFVKNVIFTDDYTFLSETTNFRIEYLSRLSVAQTAKPFDSVRLELEIEPTLTPLI